MSVVKKKKDILDKLFITSLVLIAYCVLVAVLNLLSGPGKQTLEEYELPWGAVQDFVVDSQGQIYLLDTFYLRLHCYDPSGHYLWSRCLSLGRHRRGTLHIDAFDRLYLIKENATLLAKDRENDSVFSLRLEHNQSNYDFTWRLNEARELEFVSTPKKPQYNENRTIQVGDWLWIQSDTKRFHRADGAIFRLNYWSVEQLQPDNSWKVIVREPWYFIPFTIPVLVYLFIPSIICAFIWMARADYRKRKSQLPPITTRQPEFRKKKKDHWRINAASEERWQASLFRKVRPSYLKTASQMWFRVQAMEAIPELCWHDVNVMLNPGEHETVRSILSRLEKKYQADLPDLCLFLKEATAHCLSLNPLASRDDVFRYIDARFDMS